MTHSDPKVPVIEADRTLARFLGLYDDIDGDMMPALEAIARHRLSQQPVAANPEAVARRMYPLDWAKIDEARATGKPDRVSLANSWTEQQLDIGRRAIAAVGGVACAAEPTEAVVAGGMEEMKDDPWVQIGFWREKAYQLEAQVERLSAEYLPKYQAALEEVRRLKALTNGGPSQ